MYRFRYYWRFYKYQRLAERKTPNMTKKLSQEKREALRGEAARIVEWGRKNNFPMQPKKSGKKAK